MTLGMVEEYAKAGSSVRGCNGANNPDRSGAQLYQTSTQCASWPKSTRTCNLFETWLNSRTTRVLQ